VAGRAGEGELYRCGQMPGKV